jgi:hypothetical protein
LIIKSIKRLFENNVEFSAAFNMSERSKKGMVDRNLGFRV